MKLIAQGCIIVLLVFVVLLLVREIGGALESAAASLSGAVIR